MENQTQKSLEQEAPSTKKEEAFVEEMLKGFIQALLVEESLSKQPDLRESKV